MPRRNRMVNQPRRRRRAVPRRRTRGRMPPPVVSNQVVRRNNAASYQMAMPYTTMALPSRPRRPARSLGSIKASQDGIEFLKATIAPRDFPGIVPSGVPDRFGGATFVMQHQSAYSVSTSTTQDLHLFLLPCLPSALWSLLGGSSATSTWTPYQFPNVLAQVFADVTSGTDTTSSNISAFRVLGGTVELVPTTAPSTTPGVVIVGRVPVRLNMSEISGSTAGLCLLPSGMSDNGITPITSGPHYSGPLASGVYAPMVCNNPDFQFVPTLYRHPTVPVKAGDALVDGILNGPVVGYDNGMGSVGIVIPATSAGVVPLLVTVSLLVEYLPDTGNLLSYLSHQSPAHDPVAMAFYEAFAKELPVAVPAYENSGFWSRFLSILGKLGGALSVVPGPAGAILGAGGALASAIATAID